MTSALQFSPPVFKHITGWLIFIVYEVSFVYFSAGHTAPALHYMCYYVLNIALFYFNSYVLLSAALRNNWPFPVIVLLMLAELLVYLLLKYALDLGLASAAPDYLTYVRQLLVPNVYRGISFIGYSTLYWSVISVIKFQRQAYETERARLVTLKEKAELEKNLAESMNAYLQQQINPHLLFNSLNFIHNTFYKYSREAARCVMLLADIMRFYFEDVGDKGKTELLMEIEQIHNFIALNQLRFHHTLCLEVNITGDPEGLEIIPLVLLTLTENIFKHGHLINASSPARLSIHVTANNELQLLSWNLKKHQPENKRLRATGIKNIIKRLDYSYKGRYSLVIADEPTSYQTTLTLRL